MKKGKLFRVPLFLLSPRIATDADLKARIVTKTINSFITIATTRAGENRFVNFLWAAAENAGASSSGALAVIIWVLFVNIKRVFMSNSTLFSTGELNGSPEKPANTFSFARPEVCGENCSRSTTALTMKSTANSGNWGERIFYLDLTSHPPPLFLSNTWNSKNSLLKIKRKVLFRGWDGSRNSFHSVRC